MLVIYQKQKAEQYLREVMARYRNKLTYDANTGEIRDDKKYMSMMEDFWLPRREGGRGTEISTLPGGQNLGELTDVEYFQKKLFRSLNVPESRMADNASFSLGRSSEVLRDELKFSKFVGRMRKRFSNLFHDILKTQLILKNVVTPEEWEQMSDHIQYDYLYDNHFAELKDAELMQERLGLVATADPYIGKYYSVDYIRRKILRQTDSEINEEDKLIAESERAGLDSFHQLNKSCKWHKWLWMHRIKVVILVSQSMNQRLIPVKLKTPTRQALQILKVARYK